MGNTYIVVSHVHLLDHVCCFTTLRLWVGGLVGVLILRRLLAC
jgi:presenilin-like A22 family membrane protease